MGDVERYGHCDDWVTLNNASALLDELMTNAKIGPPALFAWYEGEKRLIRRTLEDLEYMRREVQDELDAK